MRKLVPLTIPLPKMQQRAAERLAFSVQAVGAACVIIKVLERATHSGCPKTVGMVVEYDFDDETPRQWSCLFTFLPSLSLECSLSLSRSLIDYFSDLDRRIFTRISIDFFFHQMEKGSILLTSSSSCRWSVMENPAREKKTCVSTVGPKNFLSS